MLAATAAMVLGIDPVNLADFSALEGRMDVKECDGVLVVDNSNSGTNRETTVAAAEYLRSFNRKAAVTLVIGQEEDSVCEGFSAGEVFETVSQVHPEILILVGDYLANHGFLAGDWAKGRPGAPSRVHSCHTLEEGRELATRQTEGGGIILAVKTWR